ncbi:MAG: TIGR03790 family protein [Planctomycetia bacterium]|nr:TIGR03790 family protein [Planctomycetia bacterium]
MSRAVTAFLKCLLAAAIALSLFTSAQAGLGPENVCLVVNSRSWASLTIANHYAAWRKIPAQNIVHVDWAAQIDVTSLDEYRLKLLTPILGEIKARGLERQIDAIVYSSDFPYAVRYGEGREVASLTGVTCFAAQALASDTPDFAKLMSPYAIEALTNKSLPGVGFRSRIGRPAGTPGEPMYLSAMLAYTSGRGNSVAEALAYLERSVKADGASPRGTIYYCRNRDIRSTTREPGFATAVARLKKLGVKAEVIAGELPSGKQDVQGAMLGVAKFNWKQSQATILPGAICEHLTSYGGILHPRKGQTPFSELLRYGAAGSSGTVIEPYALAAKFPDPMMHVYYAEGNTLLEAFYLSIIAPYQLLVVGDPLCAPWAHTAKITVAGLEANESISAVREVRVDIAASEKGHQAAACEWFVDGRRAAVTKPDAAYSLDPSTLSPGAHELRAVVIAAMPQATQSRAIVPFVVSTADMAELAWTCPERAVFGEGVTIDAAFAGAVEIELYLDAHSIGKVRGDQGQIVVDTTRLGMGPARLSVEAHGPGGKAIARGADKLLKISQPAPLVNRRQPVTDRLLRGIEVTWKGGQESVALSALESDWLAKTGVPAATPYTASAWFEVSRDDVYQFQLRFNGELSLTVDGTPLLSQKKAKLKELFYAPVALKTGRHLLEITGQSDTKPPALDLRYGNTPVDYITGETFRHAE